ncbi:MAG: L-lactate dehydrogenase [Pirellulales bacterium]
MKVGVVGAGFVGSTAAYALVQQGIGREIVLVDKNVERAAAEANDLLHAVPFTHPMRVRAGDYADLAGTRAVVLAAGANQRPGETRLQLLGRNAAVFREIVPQILQAAPEATLIVATNPVDVMTHVAVQIGNELDVPRGRIFGSGTTLDTARFRALLSHELGVDAHHVHAYVVGEHGDSEVLAWSQVTVAGMGLDEFAGVVGKRVEPGTRQEIDQNVRRAAYQIIAGKGATYYGIGAALARIVRVVLHDQRAVLTVCSVHADVQGVPNVTLSLPQLVGGHGVLACFPQPLADEEAAALRASAETIRAATDTL